MRYLKGGQFFGQTNETNIFDGAILTDVVYTHQKVDWHYHENPYFTFILRGNLIEGNKREVLTCTNGALIYHNWQEPHYNIKPDGYTRGFHIELDRKWKLGLDYDFDLLQGSTLILDPQTRLRMYRIFRESKINDDASRLTIQGLILEILDDINPGRKYFSLRKPAWISRLREVINDRYCEHISLAELSSILQVHPVHLSREFPKHFNCSMGEYIRKLRIEKSLLLMTGTKYTLTQIASECGFADQSHYIRCFREALGVSPLVFRKFLIR